MPNPGKGAVAYCIRDSSGKVLDLGGRLSQSERVTNNEAEFAAVTIAFQEIKKLYPEYRDLEEIHIYSDSQLVVKILGGEWPINHSKPYGKRAQEAVDEFTSVLRTYIHWIPRERNVETGKFIQELFNEYARRRPREQEEEG